MRGVLTSVLSMIEQGATYIGVATDHVVESVAARHSVMQAPLVISITSPR